MSQTKAQLLGPLVGNDIDVEGDLNFDSGTFKVDPTNDRVGIKNSNPTKTLDVGGDTQVADLYYTADYPTIRPSLDLAFDKVKRLDSRVTFTRTSTATYVGTDGLIKTAAANEPRFDHDPITGESLGFLIEESRTNYAVYSSEFDNVAYNKYNATVVANQAVAPDGTTTADLMYPNSNGTGRGIEDIYTLSSTGVYTTSVYVKSAGLSWIQLYAVNGGQRAFFNVSTGTKGVEIGGGSLIDWDIIDAGNGWYRCYVTYNLTTIAGNEYFYIYFADGDNNTSVTANGTNGVYIWGVQVEAGSFATSYIPTTTATVTRSVDVASMTGTNFSSWYNQTEGTIFSQHSLIDGVDNNNNCYVYQVDNGTNNEVAFRLIDKNTFYSNPSKLTVTSLTSASSITLLQKSSASSGTTLHSTSYAVKTNDFAVTFDGATVQTDDSGTLPSNQTTLSIGYNSPANTAQLNGHIKRLTYYPRRLNNSQLQNITL